MKILEIFLSILGIIAIVAAGVFILIFIVDLFLSIYKKNNGLVLGKNKEKVLENKIKTANNAINIKGQNRVPYYVDAQPTVVEEIAETGIDYEAAAKEQAELEKLNNNKNIAEDDSLNEELEELPELTVNNVDNVKEEPVVSEEDLALVEDSVSEEKIAKILEQYEDVINLEQEKTDEEDALKDFSDEQNGLEEIKDEQIKNIIANEDESDELEKLIKDLKDKDEKEEFEQILTDVKDENLDFKKELDKTDDELQKVVSEKNKVQKLVEEKDKEIQRLKDELAKSKLELENQDETVKNVVIVGGATIEELEVRLEVLLERKKANAKELKKVRREYTPLNTVRKTLDSDKKKLRRKEAIVAKQNVLLYGVNNYVDIDDEKAKKLTEEHELLEGLRMSVRHCEEVLENNKERLPVLEQAYNILNNNKDTIENDIKEVEMAIAQLKANK